MTKAQQIKTWIEHYKTLKYHDLKKLAEAEAYLKELEEKL
jgi:hypothetical protein